MHTLIKPLIVVGSAMFAAVLVWGFSGTARAVECVPYESAVANLESQGWTILPDIPVTGYSVDRLLVGMDTDGYIGALSVDRAHDCVIATPAIPLGRIVEPPAPRVPPANSQQT